MERTRKLGPKDKVDIAEAYDTGLVPVITLAQKYGVSRASVYKTLRKQGVDTSKRRLPVSCTTCGKTIHRTKADLRNRKHLFCDQDCYYAFLDAGNGLPYIQSKAGQRHARRVVEALYRLQDGNIIHHEDRNTMNNHPSNLRVFSCQGDHIRYHRLGPDYVQPVWDGSK
jgi:transposase-like protein